MALAALVAFAAWTPPTEPPQALGDNMASVSGATTDATVMNNTIQAPNALVVTETANATAAIANALADPVATSKKLSDAAQNMLKNTSTTSVPYTVTPANKKSIDAMTYDTAAAKGTPSGATEILDAQHLDNATPTLFADAGPWTARHAADRMNTTAASSGSRPVIQV